MTPRAFILHSRPYKETSALVDLFTRDGGRVRAVLRGARSRSGSLARLFAPLDIELKGRSELKTLSRVESTGLASFLTGDHLFSGLYLNELLVRLLPEQDPQPGLFEHYQFALQALEAKLALEPLLRSFEWRLLNDLGYGFDLQHDVHGQSLSDGALYRLLPEAGLERIVQLQPGSFYGRDLLAMARGDWIDRPTLSAAKRLMRQALAPHLGGRPLVSRELFLNPKEAVRG